MAATTAAAATHPVDSEAWWHGAVGYQIYPRSFADASGDGTGDLWGVLDHVEHVAWLGVDFVWFNPCHPSPGLDHGYDVADYMDIDQAMGGLAAFDAVVRALHHHGIRVLLDIVPGHTSDQHAWFQAARSDPDGPERDLYVWRDPAPDGGPPNNWVSVFGGSAWSLDAASNQYWMHRFLPEQPDLNWRNPEVWERMVEVLRFWLERGVDGFRVDVAQGMYADPTWADRPPPPTAMARDPGAVRQWMFAAFFGREETPAEWGRWRRLADQHGALLLGEVAMDDPDAVATYVSDGRLQRALWLPLLHIGWDATALGNNLRAAVAAGGGRFAWPQSSHDDPRAAERFGGGEVGRRRALAFFHLLAVLPGTPVMLAGDELGLDNGRVARGDAVDPVTRRNDDREDGRDGSRTPMPWDHTRPNFGFTTGHPWLPLGSNRSAEDTVATQAADPDSCLHRMRRLLAARRGLDRMLETNDVTWLDLGAQVLALRRGDVVAACNLGPARKLRLADDVEVVAASSADVEARSRWLQLPTDSTVLLRGAVHEIEA